MKLYSVSFTALVFGLIGLSLSLPELGNNVNPTDSRGGHAKHVISVNNGILPFIKPLTGFSDTYSGTNFHIYGPYNIDVSSLATGQTLYLHLEIYNVPNRFTLNNGSASSTSGWKGVASWPGPWGPNGINTSNVGGLSITKGSSNTIQLTVETLNENAPSHLNDSWYAWY